MIKIKSPSAITARIKKIEGAGLIKTMKGSGYKLYVRLMPKMDSAFIYTNASVHVGESQRSSKRTYHSTSNHSTSNQSARAKANALFLGSWDSNDLKDYIDNLSNSRAEHRRIIAQYLKTKGFSVKQFENKKQVEAEVARNARVATRLARGGYSEDRVQEVLDFLKLHAGFKWSLETVEKYISERELDPKLLPGFRQK